MVIQEHAEKNKDDNATNKNFMYVILGLMENDDMEIKITRDNIKAVIFVSPWSIWFWYLFVNINNFRINMNNMY